METSYNDIRNTEALEKIGRQLAIQNQIRILELAKRYSETHKYTGFNDESLKKVIMYLGKKCDLEF